MWNHGESLFFLENMAREYGAKDQVSNIPKLAGEEMVVKEKQLSE